MSRQEGVVLLLGLVLTLLLGLLGASALQGALLQERIAGNLQASVRALEQAESTLLEGESHLLGALPAPCQYCLPPPEAHGVSGAGRQGGSGLPWEATVHGFYLLQNLGESERVAHMPKGHRVVLVRVTAVSRQVQGRHVLETVLALDDDEAPQRILWRQRLQEE
ncbi:pilus assembly PilX family protein [Pseudomonas sp. X10]